MKKKSKQKVIYWNGEIVQKLTLHSYEDCKEYLDEVLGSIYHAKKVGHTLYFDDGIVQVRITDY